MGLGKRATEGTQWEPYRLAPDSSCHISGISPGAAYLITHTPSRT